MAFCGSGLIWVGLCIILQPLCTFVYIFVLQSQSSSNAPDLISGFDDFKSANDFNPRATSTTEGKF
jgi:hypothetical protein